MIVIDHKRLSEVALAEAARAETLAADPDIAEYRRRSYKDDAAYLLYLAERHAHEASFDHGAQL